jgi:hypothetical protein
MKKLLWLILGLCFLATPSPAFDPLLVFSGSIDEGGCEASYGSELTTAGRAYDPDASDADVTDFTNSGLSSLDSVDTDPSIGTYNLEGTADGAGDGCYVRWGTTYSIDNDTFVKISFDAKGDGTNAFLYGLSSATTVPDSTRTLTYLNYSTASYVTTTWYTTLRENGGILDNDYFLVEEGNDTGTFKLDNLSITEATLCYDTSMYNDNAADDPASEGNSVGLWTANSTESVTSVSTGTPQNGSYHVLFDANSVSGGFMSLDLQTLGCTDTDPDSKYRLDLYVKHYDGSVDSSRIMLNDSANTVTATLLDTVGATDTSYTHLTYVFDFNSDYRYLIIYEFGGNNNAALYIDNLIVRGVLDE